MTSAVFLLSVLAGLATPLGAGLVLLVRRPSRDLMLLLLGLAAGIMTAIVGLDLLPAALAYGNGFTVTGGFLTGVLFLIAVNRFLFPASASPAPGLGTLRRTGYLIALSIGLHDLPEGMAIAAGYTATARLGAIMVLAITLHNIPEGMATAAPLRLGGVSAGRILLVNLLVSLFTPAGTLVGLALVTLSPSFLSILTAGAGGAMAYVAYREMLTNSLELNPVVTAGGFLGGLALGMLLNHLW